MRHFALIFVIGILIFPSQCEAFFKTAKATIVVMSEDGSLINGAKVTISFEESKGFGINPLLKRGLTNSEGLFSQSNKNDSNQISYSATKEGFYSSSGIYNFKNISFGRWQPWNPELKIVMRKIENPVPMYARNAKFSKLVIPVVGKEVGFDLIAFDWVPPYGNGEHADFLVFHEKMVSSRRDFSWKLRIRFSNPDDGLLVVNENFENGSEFKLPRFAPETGYLNEIIIEEGTAPRKPWVRNFDEDDHYIFRIRSSREDSGEIKAIYGKTHGIISLDPRKDPTGIYFKYYLNPDGTRNLEFNPKRNLFENLEGLERVKNP